MSPGWTRRCSKSGCKRISLIRRYLPRTPAAAGALTVLAFGARKLVELARRKQAHGERETLDRERRSRPIHVPPIDEPVGMVRVAVIANRHVVGLTGPGVCLQHDAVTEVVLAR